MATRLSRLNEDLGRHRRLLTQLEDVKVLDELLANEQDRELGSELTTKLQALEADLDRVELAHLLSGQYDQNDAVASLHAGAGGIDSQDWAEMLLRM